MKRHIIHDTNDFTVTSFRKLKTPDQHEAWLKNRMNGVGGSDMSGILGLNKYVDIYDVWMEKTGRKKNKQNNQQNQDNNQQNQDNQSESFPILKGVAMEPVLRKWFHRQYPNLELHDGTGYSLKSIDHPCMLASLDGYLYDPATESYGVLECKTANRFKASDWEDGDGNPQIPVYYLVQVTHYLAVTGWQWGYVIADNSSVNPLIIRFERDDDDIQAVIKAAEDFWGYVRRDEMPTLTTMKEVAKAFPEPVDDIIDADDAQGDLLKQYADVTSRLKELKAQQDKLKDMLCVQIGNNSGIKYGDLKATYKHQHRKGGTRVIQPWDGRIFRFNG